MICVLYVGAKAPTPFEAPSLLLRASRVNWKLSPPKAKEKSDECGAPTRSEFLLLLLPALTDWANVWRTSGEMRLPPFEAQGKRSAAAII
jgi:hypothetical protein